MPNYGREQLNSRFPINMHRTQYLELNNSKTQGVNDTTHLKNARLRGFMWNYGNELLNSRTQRYFLSQDCSTYKVHAEIWA